MLRRQKQNVCILLKGRDMLAAGEICYLTENRQTSCHVHGGTPG